MSADTCHRRHVVTDVVHVATLEWVTYHLADLQNWITLCGIDTTEQAASYETTRQERVTCMACLEGGA